MTSNATLPATAPLVPMSGAAALTGERQFGVEDLAAVALEDAQGRAAVVAGLRVLLAGLGLEVVEREALGGICQRHGFDFDSQQLEAEELERRRVR